MAFIQDPQDKDKNKDESPSQPQFGTSSGPEISAPVAPGAGPAKGTSSGRYSNISNYLRANQGYAQQQGGLAGKIGSNIGKEQQKTAQAIQESQQKFGQQAQQGRNVFNEQMMQQALQNSAQFAGDEKNLQKFGAMREGLYGGPQELLDKSNLQQQVGNVQGLTQQTGSEAGRFNLLRQMFNRPDYTSGQQRLDNLLLQGNQQQLGSLAATRRMANQAAQQLSQADISSQAQAAQYGTEAASTRKRTGEGITGEITTSDKAIADKVAAAEEFRKKQFPRILQGLQTGEINQEDLDYLNLREGMNLYNLDPTKYLSQSDLAATKQNVAGLSDYAKFSALGKLAGNVYADDTDQILAQYSNPAEEAGRFEREGGAGFKRGQFLGDIEKTAEEYRTKKASAEEQKALYEQQVARDRASNINYDSMMNALNVAMLEGRGNEDLAGLSKEQLEAWGGGIYRAPGTTERSVRLPGGMTVADYYKQYGSWGGLQGAEKTLRELPGQYKIDKKLNLIPKGGRVT